MQFLTCRLQTPIEFDKFQDPNTWGNLVPDVQQVNQSIWKFWMISNVYREDTLQSVAYSVEDGGWRRTGIITQTSACYLRKEDDAESTIFTLISSSRSAFQKLVALIENLYEPVIRLSLNNFLQENQSLSVQSIALSERNTTEEFLRTFARPVSLEKLQSLYSTSRWDYLTLSTTPNFDSPLKVSELHLNIQESRVCFSISPEEKILADNELTQVNKLFKLAGKIFDTNSETEKQTWNSHPN